MIKKLTKKEEQFTDIILKKFNSNISDKRLVRDLLVSEYSMEYCRNNPNQVIELLEDCEDFNILLFYSLIKSTIDKTNCYYGDKNWKGENDPEDCYCHVVFSKDGKIYWITKNDNLYYLMFFNNSIDIKQVKDRDILLETENPDDIIKWIKN